MFGLLEIVAGRVLITPTVQVTYDKVRGLFDGPPKPVPDGVDILSAGDECHKFLSDIGLLEPIFQSMAQRMAELVALNVKKPKPPKPKPKPFDLQAWIWEQESHD